MKYTYKLKIKVISPIYIGSGDVCSRCDYINIPEEKKIYLLDKKKWIDFLVKSKLYDSFISNITQYGSNLDIYRWLKINYRFINEKKLPEFISSMSEVIFDITHINGFKNHNIYSFIKNANREPYIPGSSIKGALVTALLSQILQNNTKKSIQYLNEIYSMLEESKISNKANKINSNIIKNSFDYKANYDDVNIKGMSGISISDSEPFKKENLKLYKKKDLIIVNGNIKSKKIDDRPVYRECIDVGSETNFTLTIDTSKLKQDLEIKNIDSIMDALSLRIKLLFGDNGIISAWGQSSNYLPDNIFDKGVLQIGGGVGFHSKTLMSSICSSREEANKLTGKILDKIFKGKKHYLDKPISPRALKLATVNNQDVFMGFCKIKEIKQ